MLTGGHIAASYLLTQGAKSFGVPLTENEVLSVVVIGNIVDLDLFVGFLTGKTGEAHHQNISHTPIGAVIFWTIANVIVHPPIALSMVFLAALFLHLVLDDIGYWAYKLKLYKSLVYPQINWLYPIAKYHKNELMKNNKTVLKYYLFKTWPISILELVLIVIALATFFLSK